MLANGVAIFPVELSGHEIGEYLRQKGATRVVQASQRSAQVHAMAGEEAEQDFRHSAFGQRARRRGSRRPARMPR